MEHDSEHVNWQWIWKQKLPQKLKGFCWLLFHERLLSNHHRKSRGLTMDESCPRCNSTQEDLCHIFKDCPKANEVWLAIRDHRWLQTSEHQPWNLWLQTNLKCKERIIYQIPWGMVFLYTMWKIWKDRNNFIFRHEDCTMYEATRYIQQQAIETYEAFYSDHLTGQFLHHKTNWNLPFAGTIKLNSDGCSKGNPGPAGYGGLFRDERGAWVHGYHGRLEEATSLEAELWGVYRGLTIILEKGMRDIVIETDSVQMVKLLHEDSSPTFQHRALLEDSKFLLQRCKCIIQHILRDGNKAANGLANLGVTHLEPFVF
ncbi:hypothetical protein CsSME_00040847 [Camellia sinensis var. sinensis]